MGVPVAIDPPPPAVVVVEFAELLDEQAATESPIASDSPMMASPLPGRRDALFNT